MYVLDCVKAFFGAVLASDDVINGLDVKKFDCFVDWWNARAGAELRNADLEISGNLEARRAGP